MEKPSRPIRLYRHPLSGHAHRAELFLSILGLPFERIDVDLAKAEQKSPDFLARNPFGQVPVIEDGDVTLPESNAILVYLANRYDPTGRWHPREARAAAEVQRWLSIASGPLHAGPATARLVHVFGAKLDLPRAQAVAAQLFTIIDRHLARRMFLAGSDAADRRRRRALQLHGARARGRRVAFALRSRSRVARARRGPTGLRAHVRFAPSHPHRRLNRRGPSWPIPRSTPASKPFSDTSACATSSSPSGPATSAASCPTSTASSSRSCPSSS
jgi:glutathione S-transferase